MRKRITFGRIALYGVLIGEPAHGLPDDLRLNWFLRRSGRFLCQPLVSLPRKLYLDNYTVMFTPAFGARVQLWRWIFNTLVRTGWYILVPGAVAVLAGYAFTRLRFRGVTWPLPIC
ncbi:MAG: hypothetical protein R3E79_09170 [Caldilineaceae bacterium]